MLLVIEKASNQVDIYNIGSEDWIDIMTIARLVVEEMGLKNVEFKLTGGVNGGRGWIGDVKNMLLDISKLKRLGWKPKFSSLDAVRETIREILGGGVTKIRNYPQSY